MAKTADQGKMPNGKSNTAKNIPIQRSRTLVQTRTALKDVLRLREVGFGDKAILEINQITGFFAWCNRTVDGLGVELEAFWEIEGATNV